MTHKGFFQTARWRRFLCDRPAAMAVCMGLAILSPLPALAAPGVTLDALSVPDMHWERGYVIHAHGVPLHIRAFRSSQDPAQVARQLLRYAGLFQHIVAQPGLTRLSGLHGDAHWLAEIRSGPNGGAWGQVSGISLREAREPAPPLPGSQVGAQDSPPAWLPSGARPLLAHRGPPGERGVPLRYIYTVAMGAEALGAYAAARLRAQGWVSEPVSWRRPALQSWRRDAARLIVLIQPWADGAIVYVSME